MIIVSYVIMQSFHFSIIPVEGVRGPAVEGVRGPVEGVRGPAVERVRGPAVEGVRGPAVEGVRGPARSAANYVCVVNLRSNLAARRVARLNFLNNARKIKSIAR